MNYLFVVAHPDDEVLGAGGLIYNLVKAGKRVRVCYMCSDAKARNTTSNIVSIRDQAINSMKVLGVPKVDLVFGEFDNIKMNVVPHLDIVKFIESVIIDYKPNVVIKLLGIFKEIIRILVLINICIWKCYLLLIGLLGNNLHLTSFMRLMKMA